MREIVKDILYFLEEGKICELRYAAFLVDMPNARAKYEKEARKEIARGLLDIFEDSVDFDACRLEIKRTILLAIKAFEFTALEDPEDILTAEAREVWDEILSDLWRTSLGEKVVELVLHHAKARIESSLGLRIPEAQISNEPGYGIPEYSLYWSYDVRSFCGRWYISAYYDYDEAYICFGFTSEESLCRRIINKIEELENKYRNEISKTRVFVFLVWQE
ncbi:MAG: hypothetical protein Q6363_008135 [Candidatus Njordarchaeota archaeon]